MSITARSTGNRIIEESLIAARSAVQEGQTLSAAMEGHPYLPILMVRMTAAGEKSGRLDEMLCNVADAYDDEVETMLATLTSLMEPFLMVFIGIVIGSMVIAMFLPIFQIGNVVSQH
jgi:type IV pilus assembly protein PilC